MIAANRRSAAPKLFSCQLHRIFSRKHEKFEKNTVLRFEFPPFAGHENEHVTGRSIASENIDPVGYYIDIIFRVEPTRPMGVVFVLHYIRAAAYAYTRSLDN